MEYQEREECAKELATKCMNVLLAKGGSYASKKDALDNFKRNAERLGMTKYQVIGIYFNKHVDSINNAISNNPDKPTDAEGMEGRIVDAKNYLTLLYCLLKEDELLNTDF